MTWSAPCKRVGRKSLLLDGSTLNVGARSEIKILKHDPQAQQTQIELAVGKVQANVQKITAPGGKFELRTKSAVIGTIDTSFVAETDGKSHKGLRCGGHNAGAELRPQHYQTVRLHKNECTIVLPGGAPTDPVLNPSEVASMLSQTNILGVQRRAGG